MNIHGATTKVQKICVLYTILHPQIYSIVPSSHNIQITVANLRLVN